MCVHERTHVPGCLAIFSPVGQVFVYLNVRVCLSLCMFEYVCISMCVFESVYVVCSCVPRCMSPWLCLNPWRFLHTSSYVALCVCVCLCAVVSLCTLPNILVVVVDVSRGTVPACLCFSRPVLLWKLLSCPGYLFTVPSDILFMSPCLVSTPLLTFLPLPAGPCSVSPYL